MNGLLCMCTYLLEDYLHCITQPPGLLTILHDDDDDHGVTTPALAVAAHTAEAGHAPAPAGPGTSATAAEAPEAKPDETAGAGDGGSGAGATSAGQQQAHPAGDEGPPGGLPLMDADSFSAALRAHCLAKSMPMQVCTCHM